jgi:hypothetical protein
VTIGPRLSTPDQRWLLAAIACGGAATLLLANGLFFLFPIFGGH